MVDLTYIVSAFNRPLQLATCLCSIRAQTHRNFECIVTDNSRIKENADAMKVVAGDERFKYLHTAPLIAVSDCYWSACEAVKKAHGNWLAFPCDDCYYPPEFAARMLSAGIRHSWDLILCGAAMMGPEASGRDGYCRWEMNVGKAWKSSFFVRRSVFPGFIGKPATQQVGPTSADYTLVAGLNAQGVANGVVRDLYMVHN